MTRDNCVAGEDEVNLAAATYVGRKRQECEKRRVSGESSPCLVPPANRTKDNDAKSDNLKQAHRGGSKKKNERMRSV